MVAEQLLRERLVAREDQRARVATCVGNTQQFEVGDDVLVEYGLVLELLEEIEDDVGSPVLDRVSDRFQVFVDAELANLVPDFAQRFDDITLRLEVVNLTTHLILANLSVQIYIPRTGP